MVQIGGEIRYMNQSSRFTLNGNDLKSIFIGFLITLAGAALTYLSEVIAKIDFGIYTPLVLTGFALLVNVVRKWITGK